MKKNILSVVFCLLLCAQAFGQTLVGTILYNFNEEKRTAEVTGSGRGYYSGDIFIPSTVVYNDIEYSVTSIGSFAFNSCNSLTSISIPSSIVDIKDNGINSCAALISIDVASENEIYSSENGVLFNKNKTTLILCPEGKTGNYVIPNSVTNIGNAFYYCSNLTSISIPEGIADIEEWAFAHCYNLTSITIPASVMNIGQRAFLYCSNLTSIVNFNPNPLDISSFVFYQGPVNCTIYVPFGSKTNYEKADVWKEFKIVELPNLSEEDIGITSSDNSAQIEWQPYEHAEGYRLIVYKDEAHTDTLEFDREGKLRSASTKFSHIIENLSSGTDYFYTLEILGVGNVVLASQSGGFTTTGETVGTVETRRATSLQPSITGYYSITGIKLPGEPKTGLYIILYSDGQTVKTISINN